MDDSRIIELYWARSENAIKATALKYGNYCFRIAHNLLADRLDCEECVNDTYLQAWNAMPPQRPARLSAFLGRITRNLSLNRYKRNAAEKRGGGHATLALEELKDCIPAPADMDTITDALVLADTVNRFLAALSTEARKVFLRRYWYFSPIAEIAKDYGMTESKVKMLLHRARLELKTLLETEGVAL